jgi:hypothetical protein
MMLGIDGDLHVVADDAGAAAARCHRTTVGIGQGDLLIGRGKHLLLVDNKLGHLLFQLRQLLGEPRHLRGQCFRRFLPVGRIELAQIARRALLQLGPPPLHLCPGEVLVPVVHGFELAAIDGDARRREKAHLAAEFDEARADLAKCWTVILAEVRNRLVIGSEPTQQPHDLDIASGLAFEPTARLHPVQIAVDVQLEEERGVIRWPASCFGIDPAEPKLGQIEFIDEDVDETNWIVLADPVFHAFRKQRALPTIPSSETPANRAGIIPANHVKRRVFTQPGSKREKLNVSPLSPIERTSMRRAATSLMGRYCCKSRFSPMTKILRAAGATFAYKMRGTSRPHAKFTGDLGNAIEVSDRSLLSVFAKNLEPCNFRLLQHNRPIADLVQRCRQRPQLTLAV